mmetsp:Transcript_42571/g.65292  ORF Transcript_42571/g.65292 Transcript_42571/m.65292 type:complete len:124 (-) Transcript_42571:2447-2818(-)
MAKYLIEQAPQSNNYSHSNISSLRRKTHSERSLITRREQAVKGLVELCMLRCIRPDHLLEAMERYVLNVLNPTYFDFRQDILLPYAARKQKFSPSGQSMVEMTKKTNPSKMNLSKMSDSNSIS